MGTTPWPAGSRRSARLWDAIGAARGGDTVGFCLDTCHAHAGGNDLTTIVDKIRAITGRIDLVHANDSRDAFDSGADRHTNFGSGTLDGDEVAAVVARGRRSRRVRDAGRRRGAGRGHRVVALQVD